MSDIVMPRDVDLEAFWIHAINAAKLNLSQGFDAQDDLTSLRPSAFTLGDTRELANELCELVLLGKKRATSSYEPSYRMEGVPLPTVGDLGILCDGDGNPRALLRTSEVEVVPFSMVGAHVAEAEGEGTLEEWRRDHRLFFEREISDLDGKFDPNERVITDFFEVLYSFSE
ncbi:ASCH domain-containing protein [Arcanobacterium ihumii]|uniref:ASCH domain-containing protein n=1 Tax=Arcanobacterium ihumii TaxID=2138162 RepID=UPI00135B7ADA|nr:ASCH domain-containing protein [Arcanobacterium ihumii]